MDFTSPDIPDAGGPAVLSLTVAVSDSGTVQVNGTLHPGRDVTGVVRTVIDDAVLVLDRAIPPVDTAQEGERRYATTLPAPRDVTRGPIAIAGPAVEGVHAPPPSVLWAGIVRVDPDTIVLHRGNDLVLRTQAGPGGSTPPPLLRQWFLQVAATNDEFFGLSGSGNTPEVVIVPARYVPDDADGELDVRLIQFQTAVFNARPADYAGTVTLQVRLHWVVRLADFAPSKGAQ